METALLTLEDMCFVSDMSRDLVKISNTLAGFEDYVASMPAFEKDSAYMLHWSEMRKDILEAKLATDEYAAKYVDMKNPQNSIDMRELETYPLELWLWNHNSRRVFALTEELQILLGATSLTSMCWDEIKLPFESFVIQLDHQVVVPTTGIASSCIFVSHVESLYGDDALLVRLFNDTFTYKPLDWFTKSKLAEVSRLKGDTRATALTKIHKLQECTTILRRLNGLKCSAAFVFKPKQFGHNPVSDGLSKAVVKEYNRTVTDAEPFGRLDPIFCLIATFCAYLQTLPPSSEHLSAWTKHLPMIRTNHKHKVITSGAQICEVASSFTLTSEEKQFITDQQKRGGSAGELAAHWRRGNIHRLTADRFYPEGTLPSERKRTVWVRPCLVRKDLVKPGELVSGAVALMK
jgi:hypothetical protein